MPDMHDADAIVIGAGPNGLVAANVLADAGWDVLGLEVGRLAIVPVRRLAEETFRGEGGGLLLTGNSLHADISPEGAGSGLLGWMMTALGQHHGFPVPQGGAAALTEALVARLESRH